MARPAHLVVAVALAALAGGCSGDDGPERAVVSGTVKIDGQPLEEGSINFIPIDGTPGPTAGGVIAKGEYRIARDNGVVVGKNRAEIHGTRKTGKMIPNHMVPGTLREELVDVLPGDAAKDPALVKEVKSGDNVIDFDLKGRPASASAPRSRR